MKLLQLDDRSLHAVFDELPEWGMDFAIVSGDFVANDFHFKGILVVRGNGYAVPIEEHGEIYSFKTISEGHVLPSNSNDIKSVRLTTVPIVAPPIQVNLPPGYVPIPGPHPLLGSYTLPGNTTFYRYTADRTDYKFNANRLLQDTYLTTENDAKFVNSGFGAVGRYAIPIPTPASWKHTYEIQVRTTLRLGTVAPQFGQAGGGVEVKTINVVSPVVCLNSEYIGDG